MARKASGGTPATAALARAGVAFTLHEYPHDPRAASFGLEAAEALGLDPACVLKTLLVTTETPGQRARLAVAVVPVAGRLDLKAMARALGVPRVAMADPAAAERATGYVVGGISPVGQRTAHPTVVDAAALEHPTVYVSAGRRGLDVGLAPADLVRVTDALTGPIGRD
ncbi:MAG: Cys-tRNA(Pro) deacylase [Nocardioides sp.]